MAVAFFLHIFLPPVEPEVKKAWESVSNIENQIEDKNTSLLNLSSQLNKKEITLETFNTNYELIKLDIQVLKTNLTVKQNLYTQVRNENKIFGFPSRNKFLFHFGIGLIISILALELMVSAENNTSEKKQAKKFAGLTAGTIGGYYMAWVFVPSNDLSTGIYLMFIFIVGLLSSVTAYWIISIKGNIVEMLKSKIRFLMNKIVLEIPEMVSDKNKYRDEIINPIIDKVDE